MRGLVLAAVLLAGVQPPAASQPPAGVQPPKPTATIRGRITSTETGRPLRRAQITVVSTANPADRRTASTNVRGEYEIKDLPAGQYTISVSRSGYLAWEYGRRQPGEPGAPIDIADAEVRDKIDFALIRASAITGRVIDETGEAVPGVTVYVMRPEFFRGRRRLTPVVGGLRTDDTGQYRATGLQPGEYFVVATLRETWVTSPERNDKKLTFGYAPTFFPGTPTAGDAQRVKVVAGKDAPNIDIALIPMQAATISGVAVRTDGNPIPGASVSLGQNVAGPTFQSFSSFTSTRVDPDGSWRFKDLAPGDYDLSVSWTTPDGIPETGSLKVSVAGVDIEGLSLVAEGRIIVTGDLVTDDGSPLPTGTERPRVVIEPIGIDKPPPQVVSGSQSGLVGERGTFESQVPSRGRGMVRVSSLPKGWAIKSVDASGQEATDGVVDIASGPKFEGVHIVITKSFPTLTGAVTDDQGKPSDGVVVLFPADEKRWHGLSHNIRWTRADTYGRLRFEVVQPGDYLAAALRTAQPADLIDPEFLAGLAGSAKRITIRERQPQALTLTLIKER